MTKSLFPLFLLLFFFFSLFLPFFIFCFFLIRSTRDVRNRPTMHIAVMCRKRLVLDILDNDIDEQHATMNQFLYGEENETKKTFSTFSDR